MPTATPRSTPISPVQCRTDGEIAVVELHRPDKLNAIDARTVQSLSDAIDRFDADDGGGAIVITASGRAFCAGVDLTAIAEDQLPRSMYTLWEETLWRIETLRRPVLCAIHGHCIGAGVQLALACDMRVTHPRATFALPAAKEGLIPGMSLHRLWRFVGIGTARRMALFNEALAPPEALSSGLVDKIVDVPVDDVDPSGTVAAHTVDLARGYLADLQPMSFLMCKRAFSLPRHTQVDALEQYLTDQDRCLQHPGHRHAAAAWLAQTGG